MLEEVQIVYKPKFNLGELHTVKSPRYTEKVLRTFWEDDINYRERIYIVLLNGASKMIGYNLVSIGGHQCTICEIKFAVQVALLTNATAVILAHNHPSGQLNPSIQDLKVTEKLKKALELFDINLVDHIILSPTIGEYYSFLEEGKI